MLCGNNYMVIYTVQYYLDNTDSQQLHKAQQVVISYNNFMDQTNFILKWLEQSQLYSVDCQYFLFKAAIH